MLLTDKAKCNKPNLLPKWWLAQVLHGAGYKEAPRVLQSISTLVSFTELRFLDWRPKTSLCALNYSIYLVKQWPYFAAWQTVGQISSSLPFLLKHEVHDVRAGLEKCSTDLWHPCHKICSDQNVQWYSEETKVFLCPWWGAPWLYSWGVVLVACTLPC